MNEYNQPHTQLKPVTSLAQLEQLPAFAAYLRHQRLEDFIEVQMQYARALSLPLLQMLDRLPPEQLQQFIRQSVTELLDFLSGNNAGAQIEEGLKRWRANQLPNIDKNAIANYDITLFTHVRKQSMLHFAPDYCTSMQQLLQLIRELDFYSMKSVDASFETYIGLLRHKIEEQSYLTTKITNTSPGIIYLFSLQPYAVLFANETAEEFFGISNHDFMAMGADVFGHIVHPDDMPATAAFLDAINKSKDSEVSMLELRMKPKEGGYVWMRNYVSVFRRNEDGTPSEIIGNILNIQAEKETSQKLEESQVLYKQAQALAKVGNWMLDLQTNEAAWSDEMFRIFEIPVQPAFSAEIWKQYLHPDDSADVLDHIQYCIDNRQPYDKIHRVLLHNGKTKTLHRKAEIIYNSTGEAIRVVGTTQDITEQREASQKIQAQEQFIQNIADASPTILYVYDVASASFAYVNREIYFVLGYTPEEITAMGGGVTEQLYHPEDYALLPERRQSSRRIRESDIMMQYECRLRARSGEWQWFLVREVVFITDEKERPLQIVGAALDISKRKEMEKTVLHNSFLLEQSNASLEEFAYVASHDLKEPLRKISTFGDRLAATQESNLDADGKIYLSKIMDASQRMQTMISDLLSISLISGNKSYEKSSLQKVLDETVQTLEAKIEQKGAIIESDGLPEASIVVSQFRQLFQNLISNSLKFVADGVQPHIRITHAYRSPSDVKSFQLHAASQYLKIDFTDNGIGFEAEYAGKIFLVFQRLHGRSEYEGSGIGLAICKKIVEHHGGIIYASGNLGEGATFTILLPAERKA